MAAAGGICPPEWEALLDDLCERFPFAAESHVLCMLTAAQGDAEVVAECLSEYPAARLCQPWILPGEYDACGLWRPVSEVLDPPAKFHWMQPDIYFDQDAPPSPGRTRPSHRELQPRLIACQCSGGLLFTPLLVLVHPILDIRVRSRAQR